MVSIFQLNDLLISKDQISHIQSQFCMTNLYKYFKFKDTLVKEKTKQKL